MREEWQRAMRSKGRCRGRSRALEEGRRGLPGRTELEMGDEQVELTMGIGGEDGSVVKPRVGRPGLA